MATSQGKHVIVGGLGFLGRALQKRLLDHGKNTRVLDLAPLGQEASFRLVHPTSVEYVQCDLSSTDSSTLSTLQESLKDAETVYSVVTPHVLKGSAKDMRRTNLEGVQRLVEVCQQVGVPKLVYASSMAVTNQLLPHIEENEETPLPPIETYIIAYDRTKRQGEELVLQAQSNNLQVCALRLGAIMAGPGDYITQSFLENPGGIFLPSRRYSAPLDMISSHDIAKAFQLASDKMDVTDSGVGGRALFITKCKANQPVTTSEVLAKFSEELGWPCQEIPNFAMFVIVEGHRVKRLFRSPDEENTLGFPFDLMMDASMEEFTFDNSLGRKLLDFEPEETCEDAIKRVAMEIRLTRPELFS